MKCFIPGCYASTRNTSFLVVGKNGHKMEQLKDKNGKPILVLTPEAGIPQPPPPPLPPPPGTSAPLRQMISWGWSMEAAASMFTRAAGRPVIDKTGLTGLFVFKLQWIPDSIMAGPDTTPPVSPGPSIFTAVQEQLGLRLEPQRAPVEFLVVEDAEKPSKN